MEEDNNILEEQAEESKAEQGLFDVTPIVVGVDQSGNPITFDVNNPFAGLGANNDERLKPFGLPKNIKIGTQTLNTEDYIYQQYGYKVYMPGDDIEQLSELKTRKNIESLQEQLVAAGYLKEGTYSKGLSDKGTRLAFGALLEDSNTTGQDWKSTLTFVLTNPKYDISELPEKLELDYADLTNKVLNTVKSAVGRAPTDNELEILTGILADFKQEQYEGELSNAEIAAAPLYREEEIMLEGRPTGVQGLVKNEAKGFVTPSNAEAKFESKVNELFKPEMDFNQRREQTRNVANIIKSSVAGLRSIGG